MLLLIKKTVLSLCIIILAVSISFAADTKEVNIKTNLHCGSCKTKIETGLNKTNGIIESTADVNTKIVKVKYDAEKTNPKNITKAIADMGYKADEVAKTDKECCKVTGGVCKDKNKQGKSCSETDKSNAKNSKGCCDVKSTKTTTVK